MRTVVSAGWLVVVSCLALGACAPAAGAGAGTAPERVAARAAEGDTVWVRVNHVRPERRAEFERFLFEIFWPGAARLSPTEQRIFRQTRVLRPVRANADGTYTYLFIMDPYVPGASYNILRLLTEMYGEQQAAEHYRLYEESLARPQTGHTAVQSRF